MESEIENNSNIRAAMDKVVETMTPTRRTNVKEGDAPVGSQLEDCCR